MHLQPLVITDWELRYDHNGSGKVRVERIPDLILNLGRDLRLSQTASIEHMIYNKENMNDLVGLVGLVGSDWVGWLVWLGLICFERDLIQILLV